MSLFIEGEEEEVVGKVEELFCVSERFQTHRLKEVQNGLEGVVLEQMLTEAGNHESLCVPKRRHELRVVDETNETECFVEKFIVALEFGLEQHTKIKGSLDLGV